MDLRRATEQANTSSSNALDQERYAVQTLPPPVTSESTSFRERRNQQQFAQRVSSFSSRGRRNQQQPESTISSNSSRGRRNQRQPEDIASSISSRGRRHQQQPESTTSSNSSRGRRNQQQSEDAASSISSRGRRNQQQPESTTSSNSSRGRRNQQQYEDAASSFSSRGRRNQQQPESAISSNSSRGRRNQRQPEDIASSISSRGRRHQQQPESTTSSNSSRGRRNQQQPEDTASSISSRGRRSQRQPESTTSSNSSRRRRNQQQPEDIASSISSRGRRREHQRIVDYSSNLDTNDQSDEDFGTMLEMLDTAHNDNMYRIDSTGISLHLHSWSSRWYESAKLLRICFALFFIAQLVFPSPQSELFGTQITFNLGIDRFSCLSLVFQILFALFDIYILLSSTFNFATQKFKKIRFRYEDCMLIFAVTFIFRISAMLKYWMVPLDSDYENLNLHRLSNGMVARAISYFLMLQALLIWINKVLPVACERIDAFVQHSLLCDSFTMLAISTPTIHNELCRDDHDFFNLINCAVEPLRHMVDILHIVMPVIYIRILYILVKRFRFRSIHLSDDEIKQELDHEVYFGSLSRFDKFITLFIVFLPVIFLLDRICLPVVRTMFYLNQDDMNWHVKRAKHEYESMHSSNQ